MRIFCQVFYKSSLSTKSPSISMLRVDIKSGESNNMNVAVHMRKTRTTFSWRSIPFFRQFPDLLLHVTSLQRSPFQNLHIHLFLEVHSTIRLGIHWRKHAGNRSHHHPTQRPYSQWSPNGSDQSWTSVWRAFQVSQGVPSFQQKKAQ